MKKPSEEDYSEQETARRRDEALLRALSTPHKKQSEMKLGNGAKKRERPSAEDKAKREPK
jgi:hypothetical protein